VVPCAFCGVEIGYWEKTYDVLKEHQTWSSSCGFAMGLCFGNIPILSKNQSERSPEKPARSRDVCGSHFELRSNSLPERSNYYYLYFFFVMYASLITRTNFQCSFTVTSTTNFKDWIRQNNYTQWDGPLLPQFGRIITRMQSFSTWPASSNQDAHDLSDAGFIYTGLVVNKQNLYMKKNISRKTS
jgi:hypothetical protein